MQKLKEAHLYRSELMTLGGALVDRYNQCLTLMGFSPTKLKSFSIDGAGWSPEIAAEKKEAHYLNNGESNPHAIIISPQQKGKPIYMPFHSFDTAIMHLIFKTYENEINDITRDCAICVDLDQYIDAFYEPLDILKYKNISIGFRLINDLNIRQREQIALVDLFNEDNNFVDEDLHLKILSSAKKYGDLRLRKLHLQPLDFTTNSFFTEAFGGVFLLRDSVFPIVIFESEKWYKEAIKDTTHDVLIYHIAQKELIAKLEDYELIECDLEKEIKTARYERIKKQIFSEVVKATQQPIKEILSDHMLFKGYLNKMPIEDRKKVMAVERFVEKTAYSNEVKAATFIDKAFYEALYRPHSSLTPKQQDLIWKLLVNISSKDPLFVYWYDKQKFYKIYQTWNDSYKEWVIDTITKKIYKA